MRSFWSGVAPWPHVTDVFTRREEDRERWSLTAEAEKDWNLQDRECWEWPATWKGRQRQERSPPEQLEESRVLPTPWLQTSNLLNWKRIHFCCFKPPSFCHFIRQAWHNMNTEVILRIKPYFKVEEKSALGYRLYNTLLTLLIDLIYLSCIPSAKQVFSEWMNEWTYLLKVIFPCPYPPSTPTPPIPEDISWSFLPHFVTFQDIILSPWGTVCFTNLWILQND